MKQKNTSDFKNKYLIVQTIGKKFVLLAQASKRSDAQKRRDSLKERLKNASVRLFDLSIPTYQHRNIYLK